MSQTCLSRSGNIGAAFPIEGAVIASLVAWELGSGAMELDAEDIMIPYWGKIQLLVQKNLRVKELGKYTYKNRQE
jgi:hypothetical protein